MPWQSSWWGMSTTRLSQFTWGVDNRLVNWCKLYKIQNWTAALEVGESCYTQRSIHAYDQVEKRLSGLPSIFLDINWSCRLRNCEMHLPCDTHLLYPSENLLACLYSRGHALYHAASQGSQPPSRVRTATHGWTTHFLLIFVRLMTQPKLTGYDSVVLLSWTNLTCIVSRPFWLLGVRA